TWLIQAMRYQIEVEVIADAFCEQLFEVTVENFFIEPLVNEDCSLRALLISLNVNDYLDRIPIVSCDLESRNPCITLRDSELAEALISIAQHVEAIGSFWMGIHKIFWESPRRRWLAETPDEKAILKDLPNDFQSKQQEIALRMPVTPEILGSIVANRKLHAHLALPMSFYREGHNDFSRGQYANAFIKYYFYLDDLYGNGATKNKQVEERLKQSQHIRVAVQEAIDILMTPGGSENLGQVLQFIKLEKKEFTVDGLIELIVQVRGNLSHFSQKSTKMKGHAFNQYEFRGVAYFLKAVCISTFTELTTGAPPK
ncbi:MAG: hypothetical protein WCD18_23180, partial [Thermosynechococcaceae cyanobacterium]